MKSKIVTLWVIAVLFTGVGLAQNDSSYNDNLSNNSDLNGSELLNTSNGSDDRIQPLQQAEQDGNISTVMIASSESPIDGTIADTASERLGVPVVLTDPDQLNDATRDQLDSLNVENVVIVGGPAALSENVEEDISSVTDAQIQRVYGETASDTSIEVAETFWPEGYSQVKVVEAPLMTEEQETYRLLSAVVNVAEENPVLVADTQDSQQVVQEVQSQNLDSATVYTLGNESSIEQDLGNLDGSAEFNQGSVEELTEPIYSQIQDNPENRELFTLTGADFTYGLPTYAHPSEVTYVATSETVNETTGFITNSEYTTVNLIGEQELAGEITSQINETGVQTQFIQVEDASETSAEILQNNTEEWSNQANTELIQEVLGTTTPEQNETQSNQTQNDSEMNESEMNGSIINDSEMNESNESELPTSQDGLGSAQSTIQLNSDEEMVEAQASYTSEQPYVKRTNVDQSNGEITFMFELVPAEEANETPEQGQYEYSFSESVQPDSGEYETRAELIVDGETVDTANGTAQIQ